MTIGETFSDFKNRLSKFYDKEEAEQIAFLAFEHTMKYSRIDVTLNSQAQLMDDPSDSLGKILSRLESGMPIQYVLGHAWFYGLDLAVNKNVLIPRRETEELVQWIIKDTTISAPVILDICTGSGCIALALKREIPKAIVSACDISEEALGVAVENAQRCGLQVDFFVDDALNMASEIIPTIVVCNPPYVTLEEVASMNNRVTGFEPHSAIFVRGNDPLIFYRRILKWIGEKRNPVVYFEINEKMGNAIRDLLAENNFTSIEVRKDLQGKERMVKAKRVSS